MKTYYEVLNLEKDCTAKEIKDSYLKLSKKYHPDKNKSADAHSRFVEVNEAYSVLGKSNSRHNYDESLSLARQDRSNRTRASPRTYEYYAHAYATNQKKQQQEYNGGLYFNRSKFGLILFCFAIMTLGSFIQLKVGLARKYFRSHEIADMYKEHQDHNSNFTREEKIKHLKATLLNSRRERENLRKQ